jgi:hypothetical protein
MILWNVEPRPTLAAGRMLGSVFASLQLMAVSSSVVSIPWVVPRSENHGHFQPHMHFGPFDGDHTICLFFRSPVVNKEKRLSF